MQAGGCGRAQLCASGLHRVNRGRIGLAWALFSIRRQQGVFTGIIQGKFPVRKVTMSETYGRLAVELPDELQEGLKLGDSVAIDGVCLTVCELASGAVTFDVIRSTLERSIASRYQPGDLVHVERSMRVDSEIGGHELSGHVDTRGVVERVEATEGNLCVFFRLAPEWGRYVMPQGFIAISGASLTISDCLQSGSLFSVWLIPETRRLTNLGDLQPGDEVNIEIHRGVQVVVDTIERAVNQFLTRAIEEGKLDTAAFKQLTELQRLGRPDADD